MLKYSTAIQPVLPLVLQDTQVPSKCLILLMLPRQYWHAESSQGHCWLRSYSATSNQPVNTFELSFPPHQVRTKLRVP